MSTINVMMSSSFDGVLSKQAISDQIATLDSTAIAKNQRKMRPIWEDLVEDFRWIMLHHLMDDPSFDNLFFNWQERFLSELKDIFGQGSGHIIKDFMVYLCDEVREIRRKLLLDASAAFAGDPSARSVYEVWMHYPGFTALLYYRFAHFLDGLGLPFLPGCLSAIAREKTSIDIHFKASIDEACFIDHGVGVVIGETAVVGKRVKIYHGVTLGVKSIPELKAGFAKRSWPRHPILEDDVVIYSGASILRRIVVGAGSIIAAQALIMTDIPPKSLVKTKRESSIKSQNIRMDPA